MNIDELYDKTVKEVTKSFHDKYISTNHRYTDSTMSIAEEYVKFIIDSFAWSFMDESVSSDE